MLSPFDRLNNVVENIRDTAEVFIPKPDRFEEFCVRLDKYKRDLIKILREKE